MKCLSYSNRFYYKELSEEDANCIKKDLILYNSMLHTAYKKLDWTWFYGVKDEISLGKQLKAKYGTNDYFPLSAIHEARALLKSKFETNQRLKKACTKRIERIKEKIHKDNKSLQNWQKKKEQLIQKSKEHETSKTCLLYTSVIAPNQSDPPIAADYENFAKAINNNGEDTTIMPAWTLSLPDDSTPLCSNLVKGYYDNKITESCIWDEGMKDKDDVTFYAENDDIIVYLPIEGELTIENYRIYFDKIPLIDENGEVTVRQLYFYVYPANSDKPAQLTIEGKVDVYKRQLYRCQNSYFRRREISYP